MLPSGIQMLPLLWLLLWTPKLGLSSPYSQGNVKSPVSENMPTLYSTACDGVGEGVGEDSTTEDPEQETEYYPTNVRNVLMLGRSNAIYKQFRNSQHNVYMVFNATELREAVPKSSSLSEAVLELHTLNQRGAQTVLLFEKYGKKSWRFIRDKMSALSNTAQWLSWDVTGAVCQWLRNRGEFEVLRLRAQRHPDNTDSVLHMEISGINHLGDVDPLGSDGTSIYQPTLRLKTTPAAQPDTADCIRHL